jgi:aspartate/methionine/tyrosine aminotransferase
VSEFPRGPSAVWPETDNAAIESSTDEPIARVVELLLERYHAADRVRLAGSPNTRMPPHVLEAVLASVQVHGYAPSVGEERLRLAIHDQLSREGVTCDVGNILVTNGAMHALDLAFRTVLSVGDEVLMPRPGFFIDGLVRRAGGVLKTFDSPVGDGFRPDWAEARKAVTPRTRVLYLNSPVNPTGYVFTHEDVEAATALAEQANLWIVSDESLSRFTYGGRNHISPFQSDSGQMRTFLIRSFSKDYAMPGWRMGFVVAPPTTIQPMISMLEWTVLSVSRIPQAAAAAALSGPRDWIESLTQEAAKRGARFADALNELPGIKCVPPQGGLNVFPSYDGDAEAFARHLVVESGVPAYPGAAFGTPGHFRLQFGGVEGAVDIALDRIADALGGH